MAEKKLPVLIGLDVGFGETKIISSAKPEKPIIYPSFVHEGEKGSSRMFALPEIDPDSLNVKIDDRYYFVGEYAKNIPSNVSKRTKANNRAKDEISRVLFKTAIALACPDEEGEYEVNIVTGLPNSDYDTNALPDLEEFLSEDFEVEFILSQTESVKKKIVINNLDVLRQPEGSMNYSQFKFSHKDNDIFTIREGAKEYIGIIDIGHFTTDYGLFNRGVIIQSAEVSGSTIAIDSLYRMFKTDTVRYFSDMGIKYEPTDADLDKIIRTKKLTFAGKTHDMTEIYNEGVRITSENIVKQIMESWSTEINRVESIILTGGGAHPLAEEISRIFEEKGVQAFTELDRPTVANAIGFYMFGTLKVAMEGKKNLPLVREEYINPILEGEEDE